MMNFSKDLYKVIIHLPVEAHVASSLYLFPPPFSLSYKPKNLFTLQSIIFSLIHGTKGSFFFIQTWMMFFFYPHAIQILIIIDDACIQWSDQHLGHNKPDYNGQMIWYIDSL